MAKVHAGAAAERLAEIPPIGCREADIGIESRGSRSVHVKGDKLASPKATPPRIKPSANDTYSRSGSAVHRHCPQVIGGSPRPNQHVVLWPNGTPARAPTGIIQCRRGLPQDRNGRQMTYVEDRNKEIGGG